MAMYSGMFDDSGHPDSGKYLVVAGGVADVDQWVHFEREWKDVLAPFGVTIFHTTDFYQRDNPKIKNNTFRGMTYAEAKELIDRLAGIICRRVEKTFSSTIPLSHYNAINAKYLFAEYYGFPYPAAARACMYKVKDWANLHSVSTPIEYFFESGTKHKGQLEWLAEKDRLPTPNYKKKEELCPLQMGDFLAWHQYAYLEGTLDGIGLRALERLGKHSNNWTMATMLDDPERVPTILNIPLRDPEYHYKCRIIRKDGQRMSLMHKWHKQLGPIAPKPQRSKIILPDPPPPLGDEDFDHALAVYESTKRNQSVS
jgi:hypothetical protein